METTRRVLNPIHRDSSSQAQGLCKATSKQLPKAEEDVSSALSLCFFVMGVVGQRGSPDSLAVSQGERLPGWLAEAARKRVKHERALRKTVGASIAFHNNIAISIALLHIVKGAHHLIPGWVSKLRF